MKKQYDLSLVWLRRDLRLVDNRALAEAGNRAKTVAVVFVFDTQILNQLKSKQDQRLSFIFESLLELDAILRSKGSQLIVRHGDPVFEIPRLTFDLKAQALFYNEDYEPYAQQRDKRIESELSAHTQVFSFKDQVIFSGHEILKSDGKPYQVFTPYMKAWLKELTKNKTSLQAFEPSEFEYVARKSLEAHSISLALDRIGFEKVEPVYEFQKPGRKSGLKCLDTFGRNLIHYSERRDFPVLELGTSGLSVHLRFGTLSVRECVRLCYGVKKKGPQIWLSELIWREFYHMILDQFPYVAEGCFKKQYDNIEWVNDPSHFKAWCEGKTGFPIVDSAMRELNRTGWMHNRLRMVVASFLVKDLLVDWRMGESYFADKLLDFDLAANNGGWQWCASTGCDSQPYFRIFNPSLQSQKFDFD
ncbi:MAG: deoxyribodipyrimidine photo-lyase [Bdellovibrionales bacterium]|nr:deoxyribodipyrimidine photo-lyase [Bdellovibrionales bacterium]